VNNRIFSILFISCLCSQLIVAIISVLLYSKIPHIDDLYNALYNNSRPEKPESTFIFLFGFLFASIALSALAARDFIEHFLFGKAAPLHVRPAPLFGAIAFMTLDLFRLTGTYGFYGVSLY